MSNGRDRITKVELWPIDIPITDAFVVATGQRLVAENIFVRLTLESGAVGYGEMAPFPEVGGESRDSCLKAARELAAVMLGKFATHYHTIARTMYEMAAAHPAARCGLETALLDALCRELGIPLWALWGGADVRERETDITIPITTVERAISLGRGWYTKGFRLFKTKVGVEVEQDIHRVEALHRALPDIAFIIDANQGFTEAQCRTFVKEISSCGATIVLLEQPVPREDLEGMAALRRDLGIPVAADESVRSLQDAKDIARREAADFINIKITKCGLLHAIEIATFARSMGLRLMAGGMVETRIAMGCSFALTLGLGGFERLDLDTPLLLATDPVKGGYSYAGPMLQPCAGAGLDMQLVPGSETIVLGS
ncbi:MAG: dipeptide epimerase [Nitrospirales bacterium]|nr:dipeptide epimerase [Nitrospirales bacterium]